MESSRDAGKKACQTGLLAEATLCWFRVGGLSFFFLHGGSGVDLKWVASSIVITCCKLATVFVAVTLRLPFVTESSAGNPLSEDIPL